MLLDLFRPRTAVAVLALSLATLGATAARADSMFSATADVSISIAEVRNADTGAVVSPLPGDLATQGNASIFTLFDDVIGVGTADSDATVSPTTAEDLSVGETVDQLATVSGSVINGEANALSQTDSLISVLNEATATTYVVDLLFSYDLSASSVVDDPATGSAGANASLLATIFADLTPAGPFNEILDFSIDVGGTETDALIDSATVSVTLSPGGELTAESFVDAGGAASAIPEPGSLALVGFGLGGLGLFGLRRLRRA